MLACLRRAVDVNPNDFAAQYTLGTHLLEIRQFAEAEEHLMWCARRRPEDHKVQEMVARAVRERVARSGYSPTRE
jgi:predicted Zn-dependent protease